MGCPNVRQVVAFALTVVAVLIASVDSAAVAQPKADKRHYDSGHRVHSSGYGSSSYHLPTYGGSHDDHYHHHVHKYESPHKGYLRGSLSLTGGGGINPYYGLGYPGMALNPLLLGLPSMLGYGLPGYGLGGLGFGGLGLGSLGLGGSSLYGGIGGIAGGSSY
ncbi:hypothetical protein SK128_013564, partial [Halocaridina rubra]